MILTFRPFPVDVLPPLLREIVKRGAKAFSCDPSYLALPLLTVAGSAIGNTRCLLIKDGWNVLPLIWSILIGESGSAKTLAFNAVMKTIEALEDRIDGTEYRCGYEI